MVKLSIACDDYLPKDELELYIDAMNEIEEYLNSLLFNLDSNSYRTSSRIKSLDSVIGKLDKKQISYSTDNIIDNIHDISGIRVVFGQFDSDIPLSKFDLILEGKSLEDIEIIVDKKCENPYNRQNYMTYYLVDRILADGKYRVFVDKNGDVKSKDYIREPKPSGYSSYHIILVASNGKCVEVQIRNLCQHLWSVLEHKVIYKNKEEVTVEEKKSFKFFADFINNIEPRNLKVKKLKI